MVKRKTKINSRSGFKINPQKLSRIITSRACMSAQDYLVDFYDKLSPKNRQDIKEMLNRNKNEI